MQALLTGGADANHAGRDGATTPLLAAAVLGFSEVVRVLVAAGADLDAGGVGGGGALMGAVRAGRVEVVKVLVKAGAEPGPGEGERERPRTRRGAVPAPSECLPRARRRPPARGRRILGYFGDSVNTSHSHVKEEAEGFLGVFNV